VSGALSRIDFPQPARLLAEPARISSRADAEREAKLTKLNGKLYTVAKAEFDKSCLGVATVPSSTVVR
jgi:hypothetical protein